MNKPLSTRRKADFSGCACSGAHLPKLVQPLMLAALAREPLYGYAITQRIAGEGAHLGTAPDHAGVYRLLRGMEKRGLLRSKLTASDLGPARREYTLTARGRACLAQWADSLSRYRDTIDVVLKLCRE